MKLNWKTLFLLTTCCTLGLMTSVKAQIIPDNSLGAESSTVGQPNQAINGIPINQIDQINGGARRGGNLFHSFGEFNVNAGRGAYFTNPDGVGNILTRVTGVNRSNILGTLGVLGNANLFLINPNGIFFGPNASLDVRGSFLGSSANSLLFDNGFEFSATNPQAPPLLTVNIPIGLRFRDNPGNITNQSLFPPQVEPGNTLALIGGDVNFDGGSLTALGVNVEIGGLKAPGTVGINNDRSLSFPDGVTRGDISFSNGASVDVRFIGGGSIAVNGRNVEISGGSSFLAGIFSGFGMSEAQAGDIVVNATDKVTITGTANFASVIANTVGSEATGNAGNIKFNTNNLILSNAQINSSTSGQGNAGNISLQVGDAIAFTDSSIITANVQGGGSGRGGNIDIWGRSLTLTNGSQIQAGLFRQVDDIPGGIGTGGSIKINTSDFVDISGFRFSNGRSGIFAPAETGSNGSAGSIDITTGAFRLTNFGIVTATNENGNNGGNITINAKTFEATNGLVQTSLSGQAETDGLFKAGDIKLNVSDSVTLKEGSRLNSFSSGEGNAGNVTISAGGAVSLENRSRIFSDIESTGKGNSGDVNIQAGSLSLKDGSVVQVGTFGRGNAGSAIIKVQNRFSVDGIGSDRFSSGIFSSVQGDAVGNAGGIDISTGTLFLTNGAQIGASTFATGNAGIVKIQASDISLNGVGSNTLSSGILSNVERNGIGNAGGIDITTGTLTLKNGAQIGASTFATGNAGIVKIQASDISFDGVGSNTLSSGIFSNVETNGVGDAGGIDITTKTLSLTNGGVLSAGTSGNGNAGNVTINASDRVSFDGLGSNGFGSGVYNLVGSGARGNSGDVNIKAGSLSINNFGLIANNTFGQGNAGKVSVRVDDAIVLANSSQIASDVGQGGEGIGGDIDIRGRSLTLAGESQINSSTFGRGNAGNILLQVGDVIALANSSQIRSVVEQGGEGIGGNINIRGRSLTLTGGSQIGTVLFREGNGLNGGKGRAGNIDINATDFINILGVGTTGFSSGLFASAERGTTATSRQAAGNINLTTGNFRIADGAVVNALTSNSGDAGNITINANTFTASGGGQVLTTTRSSGNAGNINLNVRDRIAISGSDPNYNQRIEQAAQSGPFFDDIVNNQGAASGIFANTARNSTGNGGNITIKPLQNRFPTIAISDGAEVTVDSQGQGRGGEISITGNTLTLDRGIINASTQSADGGNINLRLRNFIRLRNESLISASAGGNGNGGNITINTPFIVAFPQNNDIIANARSGNSGRITINRSAILFGIDPLRLADLRRLLGDNNPNSRPDPRRLPTSDITAFSEQNPNFSDNVQFNSPDVDPSRGLVELPEAVSDPTQKVAQNPCRQGIGNEFFVTGRGGLPTTPNQTLSSDNVRVDLLQPVASSGNSPSATIKPVTTVTARRVPAQGWIFNDKGQVVLTAYDPTNTGSQRPFTTAAACPAR